MLIPVLVACLLGACATRQDALRKISELQKSAYSDLKKGRNKLAREKLTQAVAVGQQAKLEGEKELAPSHLILGAIYAEAGDAKRAVAEMTKALEANPKIKLTRTLAKPNTRRAFGRARARARAEAARVAKIEQRARGDGAARSAPKAAAKAADESAPEPVAAQAAPRPEPEAPRPTASVPMLGRSRDPLHCEAPDEAPPETKVVVRCVVRSDLRAAGMTLFYRPSGSETFTAVRMPKSTRGYYTGTVPESATAGPTLHYYIQARGTPELASGNSESPNLVLVREEAEAADPGGSADTASLDAAIGEDAENPLANIERETVGAPGGGRGPGSVWLAFGAGSAYGWQRGGDLEFRSDQQVGAGPLPGGLLHVLPEIGYDLGANTAVSVQLRLQYIPVEGSGDPTPGKPAERAVAVLARFVQTVGTGDTRGFVSLCAGAGDGFRLRVPADPDANLARSDTVRGGPLLGGAGVGLLHHFNPHVAWTAELRALAGLPSIALVGELSTGLQVAF